MNDYKQELVKMDHKYHFLKKLFQFYLHRFLSQSLCLSLSRFPNKTRFDHNKRDAEIFHSFQPSLDSLRLIKSSCYEKNMRKVRIIWDFCENSYNLNFLSFEQFARALRITQNWLYIQMTSIRFFHWSENVHLKAIFKWFN